MFEMAINLLRTRGRANRALYWKTVLLAWLGMFVVSVGLLLMLNIPGTPSKDAMPGDMSEWIVGALVGAIFTYGIWVSFAAAIRRLHDRDKTGWWVIPLLVVPVTLNSIVKVETGEGGTPNGAQIILSLIALGLGVWAFVEIGCLAGTSDDNRFGPDPLAEEPFVPFTVGQQISQSPGVDNPS
jgi:uncharacterized membrane protein YhaH (DUF805 family)